MSPTAQGSVLDRQQGRNYHLLHEGPGTANPLHRRVRDDLAFGERLSALGELSGRRRREARLHVVLAGAVAALALHALRDLEAALDLLLLLAFI